MLISPFYVVALPFLPFSLSLSLFFLSLSLSFTFTRSLFLSNSLSLSLSLSLYAECRGFAAQLGTALISPNVHTIGANRFDHISEACTWTCIRHTCIGNIMLRLHFIVGWSPGAQTFPLFFAYSQISQGNSYRQSRSLHCCVCVSLIRRYVFIYIVTAWSWCVQYVWVCVCVSGWGVSMCVFISVYVQRWWAHPCLVVTL